MGPYHDTKISIGGNSTGHRYWSRYDLSIFVWLDVTPGTWRISCKFTEMMQFNLIWNSSQFVESGRHYIVLIPIEHNFGQTNIVISNILSFIIKGKIHNKGGRSEQVDKRLWQKKDAIQLDLKFLPLLNLLKVVDMILFGRKNIINHKHPHLYHIRQE